MVLLRLMKFSVTGKNLKNFFPGASRLTNLLQLPQTKRSVINDKIGILFFYIKEKFLNSPHWRD